MFNENNEAIFTLEALLRINQKDHIALGIMGEALSALGGDDEAIIFFDRSLEIQPINAITLCDQEHH